MDRATSVTVNMLYHLCLDGGSNEGMKEGEMKDEELNDGKEIKDERMMEDEVVMTRINMLLEWLLQSSQVAVNPVDHTSHTTTNHTPTITSGPSSCLVSCVSSILWNVHEKGRVQPQLRKAVDVKLFRLARLLIHAIYSFFTFNTFSILSIL